MHVFIYAYKLQHFYVPSQESSDNTSFYVCSLKLVINASFLGSLKPESISDIQTEKFNEVRVLKNFPEF